jgi:hypothetical protein
MSSRVSNNRHSVKFEYKGLKKLLENQPYLNEEEMSLKLELEESIRKLFQFYDEFNQNKTNRESFVSSQFEELRSQIDQHRDKLKERIDNIAFKMKNETEIYEKIYLKSLKESFTSFDQSKSLENELNEIQEQFRNPNISIQTIKEIQRKQEESLRDIQLKLDEMNQGEVNLMASNEFQPNLSSFNQEEDTSLFGSIKLNGYCPGLYSFKGQILTDEQQYFELIKLCEFSPSDKWTLLYRGTRDGFGSLDFHTKCDGHSNTLTLLKAKQSSYIFGGFTTVDWDSSGDLNSDPHAFKYSLTNKDNRPLKMKIKANQHQFAILCHSEYGPTFGGDIIIANNANTRKDSRSDLGSSYFHPQNRYKTNEALTFLAGSHQFQLDEIEVYQKEE